MDLQLRHLIRAHRRHFLMMMVGAPRSPSAPARGGGSSSMFPSIDGGRSRISSSTASQGIHRRCFLTLMVGAPGSPSALAKGAHHRRPLQPRWWPLLDPLAAPPRGFAIDVFFNLGGGRCCCDVPPLSNDG
jgi:hypothetical protein